MQPCWWETWSHFYQTRSAWSVDQGSNKNHSPAYNFAPTVTKFCVMWEGLSLPHDTKLGNCRCKIVDSRSFPSWSLIHGLPWSGLIKVGPGMTWRLGQFTQGFTGGCTQIWRLIDRACYTFDFLLAGTDDIFGWWSNRNDRVESHFLRLSLSSFCLTACVYRRIPLLVMFSASCPVWPYTGS